MAIDTTIPGTSAEIVRTPPATPTGSAGIIAIVGKFEKGDGNKTYYFSNPTEALKQMGTSEDYPGSKVLEMAFKKDTRNNNNGATNVIAVKTGVSEGAACTLQDTDDNDVMTLTVAGGKWGNELTATISPGTLNGIKLIIKRGTKAVDIFDNCTDTKVLYNKILSGSALNLQVTTHDLTKTPVDVDTPFTGGTEVSEPTMTDLGNALDILMDEDFDILLFTDVLADALYPTIEAYLNERFEEDKPARATLSIDSTKSVEEVKAILASVDTGFIDFVSQTFIIGTEELNDAESAARIAAATAGIPVFESLTNKIISDISGLNRTFNKDELYDLTYNGLMCLELKNRKNNEYGVVSAVTASHKVENNGKKSAWSEQHAVRTLNYVCKDLNLKDWLGRTGISKVKAAAEGEINNRVEALLSKDNPIAEEINVALISDTENEEIVYEDISVKPNGIWKHIHKRINLQE